jgi:hypothetical protein
MLYRGLKTEMVSFESFLMATHSLYPKLHIWHSQKCRLTFQSIPFYLLIRREMKRKICFALALLANLSEKSCLPTQPCFRGFAVFARACKNFAKLKKTLFVSKRKILRSWLSLRSCHFDIINCLKIIKPLRKELMYCYLIPIFVNCSIVVSGAFQEITAEQNLCMKCE